MWQVVNQIGGEEGYFFGNLLWKTRGAMDLLVGHRLAKGRPQRAYLQTGDTVDSWKVIIVEEEKQLTPAIRYESARAGPIKLYH